MSLELALNLVLAGLLVAVIVYAVRLHKRLGAWREGKAELDRAATQFAKAAERAEAAVAELKMASEASGRLLEDQTRTALALKDDLEMLVARAAPVADHLLDRLQTRPLAGSAPIAVAAVDQRTQMPTAPTSLGAAAARVPLRAATAPIASERAEERSPVRSMAEQELLRAIADRRKAATPAAAQAGARGA
ncbi:MAG: hypothetical protein ING44_12360 [Telmatospirillum sp.]|nr:hypothetical protein [Telmatospirillum sp.]